MKPILAASLLALTLTACGGPSEEDVLTAEKIRACEGHVVVSGMGSDGHTASIFNGPDMDDALNAPKARRAVGVMPDPLPKEAPVPRVTLTRSAILSARTILITIRGDEKRELLEQAIEAGHSSKLPIGRVLAEAEQPIDIHWCP